MTTKEETWRERVDREAREAQEIADKRTEIVKNELVGDKCRVRCKGYKRMVSAIIEVSQRKRWQRTEDGERVVAAEWYVHFKWTGRNSQYNNFTHVRRLDVETDRGWRTVWDDGLGDLHEWDRARVAKKLPTCKRWQSGTIG